MGRRSGYNFSHGGSSSSLAFTAAGHCAEVNSAEFGVVSREQASFRRGEGMCFRYVLLLHPSHHKNQMGTDSLYIQYIFVYLCMWGSLHKYVCEIIGKREVGNILRCDILRILDMIVPSEHHKNGHQWNYRIQ